MDTIGKKLALKEKMAYGCGDAASNIIWASTGTFLMFYYTDVVNINAATIGAIFLIARVINAVVALLTGWLIDNTHSKYGKARPWLLWFAVPFGIVTFAIFAVPDVAKLYQIIYVFIAYNAMMSVYSLINIPYTILHAFFSPTYSVIKFTNGSVPAVTRRLAICANN